jgi:hypothetical protein
MELTFTLPSGTQTPIDQLRLIPFTQDTYLCMKKWDERICSESQRSFIERYIILIPNPKVKEVVHCIIISDHQLRDTSKFKFIKFLRATEEDYVLYFYPTATKKKRYTLSFSKKYRQEDSNYIAFDITNKQVAGLLLC